MTIVKAQIMSDRQRNNKRKLSSREVSVLGETAVKEQLRKSLGHTALELD